MGNPYDASRTPRFNAHESMLADRREAVAALTAENERLRQNQCSKDWCDDALTDDLKALVQISASVRRSLEHDFGNTTESLMLGTALTPRILEWAGVE